MTYKNEVYIPGKVLSAPEFSHEYDGVSYYSVNIQSNCLKGTVNHETVIRTYFSSDLLASNDVREGSLIAVHGKLINSRLRGIIDISVVVDSYEFLEEFTEDDTSRVVLQGVVTKIFTNDDNYNGFVNFVLAELDEDGKRLFSTRVVYWSRLADNVYNNLNENDVVAVTGSISNVKIRNKFEPDNPNLVTVSEVLGFYFHNITSTS